jgi:hypothetical protein
MLTSGVAQGIGRCQRFLGIVPQRVYVPTSAAIFSPGTQLSRIPGIQRPKAALLRPHPRLSQTCIHENRRVSRSPAASTRASHAPSPRTKAAAPNLVSGTAVSLNTRRPKRSARGEQLEAVAPRVAAEKPANTREVLVPMDPHSRGRQPGGDFAKLARIGPAKGWVCLPGWRESLVDTDMQLMLADGKPNPTTALQARRLLQLLQAQQLSVERSRLRLARRWRCDLNVIKLWVPSHDQIISLATTREPGAVSPWKLRSRPHEVSRRLEIRGSGSPPVAGASDQGGPCRRRPRPDGVKRDPPYAYGCVLGVDRSLKGAPIDRRRHEAPDR